MTVMASTPALPRLTRAALAALPPSVARPDFDPATLRTGIVHLGIGAFHRAHEAFHTQPLLARAPEWGILGASLQRPDTRDALAPQEWLYTLAERGGGGDRLQVMAPLTGILVAPEDPRALVQRLADPAVRIVSLTVTEKGYCRSGGDLDESNPGIRHDLAEPGRPVTALGFLAAGLRARRAAGLASFTVLTCDNLPANGETVHRLLSRLGTLLDPELGRWIEGEVACPATMLDRIVPATTDADRAAISRAVGFEDAWPVVAEPFSQWIVEDRFPQGRPDWEAGGATLVDDVRPHEEMKLRLLNGSHSTIAYLGQLAGWQSVADAMAVPDLAAHVAALMREVAETLRLPADIDHVAYQRSLLQRFANPGLRHLTAQIAMDGSQKMPQRLFAPALDRIGRGQGTRRIALGVAAWLRFLQGRSDSGTALTVNDPLAARLMSAARGAQTSVALRDAIFAMTDVVPPALAAAAPFGAEVLEALESLAARGAAATLKTWT
jgi:fructuronate reductase